MCIDLWQCLIVLKWTSAVDRTLQSSYLLSGCSTFILYRWPASLLHQSCSQISELFTNDLIMNCHIYNNLRELGLNTTFISFMWGGGEGGGMCTPCMCVCFIPPILHLLHCPTGVPLDHSYACFSGSRQDASGFHPGRPSSLLACVWTDLGWWADFSVYLL